MLIRILLMLFSLSAYANDSLDYHLKAEQIAKDTYVFIGAKEDFSDSNGGNIVNTGFIVTEAGIIVIDTGPSLIYGQQMRKAIHAVSDKKIIKVLITHHHPDHFFGNQAFLDVPIYALPETVRSINQQAAGFLDNIYRMVGPWMKGTEFVEDSLQELTITQEGFPGHELEYISVKGHTGSDLMIHDDTTGVLFTGDIVFHNRALTTPHADPDDWQESLSKIEAMDYKVIVPGHGEVTNDKAPVKQTRDYLNWLETTIKQAVDEGKDMNELLSIELPERFQTLELLKQEFTRSVTHRFPVHENLLFLEND